MKIHFFNKGTTISDEKTVDLIRRGDEKALAFLYESNRSPITAYVRRNNGTAEDANDVVQEALVILWERVRSGRFEYQARVGTFLYATAKNLWSYRLRRMRREVPGDPDPEAHPDGSISPLDLLVESEQAALVKDALGTIGDRCRRLLLLFYWEERSLDEIAGVMSFANADTVKAKKYQCKKALERALKSLR